MGLGQGKEQVDQRNAPGERKIPLGFFSSLLRALDLEVSLAAG